MVREHLNPGLSVRLIYPFLRALDAQGVDTASVLGEFSTLLPLLQDPDARVPRDVAMQLLEHSVVASGDDALGVHAAEHLHAGDFDALELVVHASHSRREALAAMQRYLGLMIDDVPVVHTKEAPMEVWSLLFPPSSPRVAVEFALGAILVVGSRLADGNQRPYDLEFAYPEPVNRAEFDRVFDCPIRWNASRNALRMATDRLDKRIANITASLTTAVVAHAEKLLAEYERSDDFSSRVREHILDALRVGSASLDDVCQRTKLSERTVRRKLQEEGNTFSELLDEVRRNFACRHLRDPNVSVMEAAFLLGFSDARAFQRAFHRWYGVTPTEYRRQGHAPPSGYVVGG